LPILHYAVELDKWDFRGLYYGIRKCDENVPYKRDDIPSDLKKILKITNSKPSFWWLSWKLFNAPYNLDRVSLKEEKVVRFYVELLKNYNNLESFIIEHYINPFMEYIEQTENILDKYYKNIKS